MKRYMLCMALVSAFSFAVFGGAALAVAEGHSSENSSSHASNSNNSNADHSFENGSSHNGSDSGDRESEHKVVVCHVPPGNTSGPQQVEIDESALETHLAHGDIQGTCPSEATCNCDVPHTRGNACACVDGSEGTMFPGSSGTGKSMRSVHGE